ncbi:MAG: hypothetical protein HYU67_08845 [Flavobacteriia bacterium]|nr:hypothetical protein [Flavobacteriia bacterium]
MKFNKDILKGFIIYPLGDLIAQIIIGEFHLIRLLVLALIGGFLYSYEIGKWFAFIEKKSKNAYSKTLLAVLFFNPLWITRHFLFIEFSMFPEKLFSLSSIELSIETAFFSSLKTFIASIIFTIIANYIIQNIIHLKYRFMSSAIFSALMNIYYALSKMYF